MLVFMAVWLTVCYAPVAHWVWGGGWLDGLGILDFSGGTVVHINAGVAALAAALVLGPRKGYPEPRCPRTIWYTRASGGHVVGRLARVQRGLRVRCGRGGGDGTGGDPARRRQRRAHVDALRVVRHGKPSVLGLASGVVSGLVAITPASGFVGPMSAIVIGAVSGIVCFFVATAVKNALRYDDSLDVFGIHCVGGIVGALLTGVFCAAAFSGAGFGEGNSSIAYQLLAQALACSRQLSTRSS